MESGLAQQFQEQYDMPKVTQWVVLAIPWFLVMIFVELAVARAQGRRDVYRISDALSSLGTGVVQFAMAMMFALTFGFSPYRYIWTNYGLFRFSNDSWITHVLALLWVDMMYYWFHRTSHNVNVIWAAHIVHHSSEEFNLTTALRQGAIQPLFSWVYYLPMALFVPPNVAFSHNSFNTVAQFWFHTRLIYRFPWWIEAWLNTPSHHRVHHARNGKYIDKNYAGILIIWDRMFGTFCPEEEEPVYGVTTPPTSWNSITANLVHWQYMLQLFHQTKGSLPYRLSVFLRGPGWSPDGKVYEFPAVSRDTVVLFDVPLPWPAKAYCVMQFVLVLLTLGLGIHLQRLGWSWTAGVLYLSLLPHIWSIGNLLDRLWYAVIIEVYRLVAVMMCVLAYINWAVDPDDLGMPRPKIAVIVMLVVFPSLIFLVKAGKGVYVYPADQSTSQDTAAGPSGSKTKSSNGVHGSGRKKTKKKVE